MWAEARGLLVEAAKVSIVVIVTFVLTPCVEKAFPEADPVVVFVLTTIATAIAIVSLYLFVFVRAHVDLAWSRESDSRSLAEVDVQIDPRTRNGRELYRIEVSRGRAFGFGWLALHIGARTGMYVVAKAAHAQLVVVVEDEDGDASAPRSRSIDGCGIEIDVPRPVPDEGVWASALVRFAGRSPRQPRPSSLKHTATGSKILPRLCGKLVHVNADALRVIERWS